MYSDKPNKKIEIMFYVKLTQDQANKIPANAKGYATRCTILGGDKFRGEFEFCTIGSFTKFIGVEEEKTLIEI